MEQRIISLEGDLLRFCMGEENKKIAPAERKRLLEYFREIRAPFRHLRGELVLSDGMTPSSVLEIVRHFYDGVAEVRLGNSSNDPRRVTQHTPHS